MRRPVTITPVMRTFLESHAASITDLVEIGSYYQEITPITGGDTVSMSYQQPLRRGATLARVLDGTYEVDEDHEVCLQVKHAHWGDYDGDTTTRAIFESLLSDYPDTFVTLSGGHDSKVLLLPLTYAGEGEDDYLLTEITALFEGEGLSMYSEASYEIEQELAAEAWSTFVSFDLSRGLAEYGIDVTDIDLLHDLWYGTARDYEMVAEDAVSVVWPAFDAITAQVATVLLTVSPDDTTRSAWTHLDYAGSLTVRWNGSATFGVFDGVHTFEQDAFTRYGSATPGGPCTVSEAAEAITSYLSEVTA